MDAHNDLKLFQKGVLHPNDVLAATKSYYDNGQSFALLSAIEACRRITGIKKLLLDDQELGLGKQGHYVPDWLLDALEETVIEFLKSATHKGIKSAQNATVEFKSCYIDLLRFDAVMNARSPHPITKKCLKGDSAYEKALSELDGTIAGEVDIDALKGSVKRVNKRAKDPATALLNMPISKIAAKSIIG